MKAQFNKICMVGLGYIGLPTAVVFAVRNINVVGLDINQATVDRVNAGECPIVEPGLDEALRRAVRSERLRATVEPEHADAFLIAVPTPFLNGDEQKIPDLSYVEAAARKIAPVLKRGDLVVLESTSPVGATELMAGWLAEERPDLSFPQTHGEDSDIRIAHCPERILPGHALKELVSNDRVIGGMTPACATLARDLYRMVVEGDCVETDARTAEMAKLTENSFRDVNIAFANELSLICERLGIDVWELIRLTNRHPRVNILQPGPGVGGHCIAVDPWFIIAQTPDLAKIIRTARCINDEKPSWVVERVRAAAARKGAGASICCFGLSFKPDIDDLRESPAIEIVERLTEEFPGQITVVEPHIDRLPDRLDGKAGLVAMRVGIEADICVMLVDHTEFRNSPPPGAAGADLIDTRGIWTKKP
ncbi:UDP-N-acetyl-D-mannosamine dehydrogenase [Paracoccus albus]|uniref:UDP-N-acetyl-D-mannosamine dehydrogenase n=1 Tax=Paracoccus albus TaxID=3017784 RepID=UPI0022F0DB6B|nr:UDP-N-acetyl-D-mannosamine dehydrogenase [Paracoccus albus]WBU62046.1 UDP-N-acetyl-D-mannosamine dehydrogenase [Paracoccus albus]